jgi:hypothetical protein
MSHRCVNRGERRKNWLGKMKKVLVLNTETGKTEDRKELTNG